MKRIFLLAVLILAAAGLPVTAVQAQPQQQSGLDAGCSPEMWNYMQDQATAMRARNKAYERDIINRQESSLYLTCFDTLMVLSAKAGPIFSDATYPSPPPANTLVFPNVTYPDWGATRPTLAMDLNSVVNPEFNTWLDTPVSSPAMYNFLPQWVPSTNTLTGVIVGTKQFPGQQSIMNSIISYITGTDASQAASYMSQVQQIDALVKRMPTDVLQNLPTDDTQYTSEITTLISTIASIQSGRASGLGPLIQQLNNVVLTFSPPDPAEACARLDNDPWFKINTAFDQSKPGAFYPEGEVYYLFTPYYALPYFLQTNPLPSPPAWPDFVQELSDATDSDALKNALNDLTGPLSKIGQSPLWPIPPTFDQKSQSNYTAQDVIDQM